MCKEVVEEGYIRTKTDEFVIKEIHDSGEYKSIKAILNVEELEGKTFETFETVEVTIAECIMLALAGTGWTLGECNVTKKRTVRKTNSSSFKIIEEAKKIYRVEFKFDTINKTLNIFENLGSDKGVYFKDTLNLVSLDIQSNSYDFFTRIKAIGKTIKDSSDKEVQLKVIVENFQHSKKVKELIWKDERYSDIHSLREDAEAKLNELSKPYRAYSANIVDLAKMNIEYKDILNYSLGDTITLISTEKEIKEKQRIVKLVEYLDEPSRNKCEIANTTLNFEDIQKEFKDTSSIVDNITSDDGTISEEAIKNTVKKLTIDKVNVNELNAVKATIGELDVNKLNVDDANIKFAEIDKAVIGKAEITDLEAATGKIGILEATTAEIKTLVNGNLTSDNIHSLNLTTDKVTVADAFIKNAMIDDISASKIKSGSIDTNEVTIASKDGSIQIADNTQQFKDKNGKVRVQLGEDSKGDFSFLLLDETGTGTLIDHTGIKEKAISDGLIKENMIGNGEIGGKKINISSMLTEVNKDENSSTIKASKIKLDTANQTLEVAFDSMTTKVEDIKVEGRNYVLGTATPIVVVGRNASNQTGRVGKCNGDFLKGKKIVVTADWEVSEGSTGEFRFQTGADHYSVMSPAINVSSKKGKIEFVTTPYTSDTKTFTTLDYRADNLVGTLTIKNVQVELGTKASMWKVAPEDVDKDFSDLKETTTTHSTKIETQQGEIKTAIDNTTIVKDGKKVLLKDDYSKTVQTVEVLSTKVGTHTSEISGLDKKVTTANSEITQLKNKIDLKVEATEVNTIVENKVDSIQIGGSNLVVDSSFLYGNPVWNMNSNATRVKEGNDGSFCLKTIGKLNTDSTSYQFIRDLKKNTEYVATVWIKTSNIVRGTINPHLYFYGSYYSGGTWKEEVALSPRIENGSIGWTKFTTKFVTRSNSDWDVFRLQCYARDFTGTIWWDNIQIEEGNKSTNWSPNPSDYQYVLDTIKTGGDNLLWNSGKFKSTSYWSLQNSSGHVITPTVSNGSTIENYIFFDASKFDFSGWCYLAQTSLTGRIKFNTIKQYVLSGWVHTDNSTNIQIQLTDGNGLNNSVAAKDFAIKPNTWNYIEYIFTPTSEGNQNYVYMVLNNMNKNKFRFKQFKLEEGNKASSWTPSVDELDKVVNDVDVKVEQVKTESAKLTVDLKSITGKVESSESIRTSLANGIRCSDLGMKRDRSDFGGAENLGEIYLHGYDSNGLEKDIDGSVFWNGKNYTVSKGMINPNADFGNNIVYICLTGDFTKNLVGIYFDEISKKWKYRGLLGNINTGDCNISEQKNICLGEFKMKAQEEFEFSYLYEKPVTIQNAISASNYESRMSSAEQKITDSAIVNTVKAHQTNGKNTFAQTSQLEQTTTSITAKFEGSGGYNLVKNGAITQGVKMFAEWKSILSIHDGALVVKPKTISSNSDFGVVTSRFKIEQGKKYTVSFFCASYSNVSSLNYNYLMSPSKGNKPIDGMNITTTLTEYSITFIAPYTADDVGVMFGNVSSVSSSTGFKVKDVCVVEGELKRKFSPHPSEIYEGIVKLDGTGVEVSHTTAKTYTKMYQDGFKIFKRGTNEDIEIGSLAEETGMTVLRASKIYANNIKSEYEPVNALDNIETIYVKYGTSIANPTGVSEATAYPSISSMLEHRFYSKSALVVNTDITINVLGSGTYKDSFRIKGFDGTGQLDFKIAKTMFLELTDAIHLSACSIRLIRFDGYRSSYNSNDGAVISTALINGGCVFSIDNCNKVHVQSFRVVGKSATDGSIFVRAFGITNVLVRWCDVSRLGTMLYASEGAMGYAYDNIGNVKIAFHSIYGASIICGSTGSTSYRPSYDSSAGDLHWRYSSGVFTALGTVTWANSVYTAPPVPPTTTYNGNWALSSWSYSSNGYWQDTRDIYQGNYGYGNHVGYMLPPSSCRSSISGSTINSASLYIRRKNGGGSSGATNIYLWGSTQNSLGSGGHAGASKNYGWIGSLAWGQAATFSIPVAAINDYKSGAINSLCLYTSDGSNYFRSDGQCGHLYITYTK